ncbi:tRNA (adenosine(37)-N6)-dimethylallyltransferase MiaA [Caldithrix abyssi]|nr:tRNA (adenosine(37)-N6)-dimethylallyltransferase MiaA [Caldithrix abyssi]
MKKILTIIGPTASGKTAIAVSLAEKLNGEIIGLDSRQIYKGVAIGTAQPSAAEQVGISYHLIDFKDPRAEVTAGEYAKLVFETAADIQKRERQPIICGGAGLYYRAITKGIFEGSVSDLDVREKLEKEYDEKGAGVLLNRLRAVDPEYAEIIHPNNKKRLVRALEIYEATGKPPSQHFQEQQSSDKPKLNLFTVYLDWERSALEQRIARRTQEMLKAGWIDEVKNLIKQYPNERLHPLDSIGYRQIISYLNGELSESELAEKIILRTRQYAKRQIQWFRKEKVKLTIEMREGWLLENITKEIIENLKDER